MRNLQYQKVQKNYFSENNWSKGRFNGVICDISAYTVNVSFCRSTWIRYQEYLSPLMLWFRISIRARCTTLCDKVCQWLATGRWFSPGPPVYSTKKTDRHDIAEILLKVVLNTINQTNKQTYAVTLSFCRSTWIRFGVYACCFVMVDASGFIVPHNMKKSI